MEGRQLMSIGPFSVQGALPGSSGSIVSSADSAPSGRGVKGRRLMGVVIVSVQGSTLESC